MKKMSLFVSLGLVDFDLIILDTFFDFFFFGGGYLIMILVTVDFFFIK